MVTSKSYHTFCIMFEKVTLLLHRRRTLELTLPPPPPPQFHRTAIPLRSWRSQNFSKNSKSPRKRRQPHDIGGGGGGGLMLSVRVHYASTTLPLRFCYDPTTTMKIRLRLVYADGDAAATLLRPMRWSYALVGLLYLFYIKSEVQLIYV